MHYKTCHEIENLDVDSLGFSKITSDYPDGLEEDDFSDDSDLESSPQKPTESSF